MLYLYYIRKPMDTVAINNPPDDQQKVKNEFDSVPRNVLTNVLALREHLRQRSSCWNDIQKHQ